MNFEFRNPEIEQYKNNKQNTEGRNPKSRNPKTNILVTAKSGDFSFMVKDTISTRFRVGDYVPMVWLKNKFAESIQLYDFLELTPDHCLVRNASPMTLWQTISMAIVIPAFFTSLFLSAYAFGRYQPLDFQLHFGRIPIVVGGALGLVVFVFGGLKMIKAGRQIQTRNVEALEKGEAIEFSHDPHFISKLFMRMIVGLGSILLGSVTVLSWCMFANALLDRSPAQKVPVQITNMTKTTHSFIFCEYKIAFRRPERKFDDSLLTTPKHLDQFVFPIGIAHVRSGWLGWPWVETIEPVLDPSPAEE